MKSRHLNSSIYESMSNVWRYLLPIDVSYGYINRETAMKLSIYHHLRLQLETRLPSTYNIKILTEVELLYLRIDLAVVNFYEGAESKNVQGDHLIAGIELKYYGGNCTKQNFEGMSDKSEKYAIHWQFPECRHYILILLSDLDFSETVVLDWLYAPVVDDEGHIQPVTKMVSYVVNDERKWMMETKLKNF